MDTDNNKLKFYYAAKIKLEQAKNLPDLLPFIESLLSVHDLKIILHDALDTIKECFIDCDGDKTDDDILSEKNHHQQIYHRIQK